MAEPYLEVFEFPTPEGLKELTSVVLDEADFMKLCDDLAGIFNIGSGDRADAAQVECLKVAKHIPMIKRGTRTQEFFDRFGIETDYMSVIVRGQGRMVFDNMIGRN